MATDISSVSGTRYARVTIRRGEENFSSEEKVGGRGASGRTDEEAPLVLAFLVARRYLPDNAARCPPLPTDGDACSKVNSYPEINRIRRVYLFFFPFFSLTFAGALFRGK